MFACGRGFHNPSGAAATAMAPFLNEQTDALDCAALPASPAPVELDAFQRTNRYLEIAVGLGWKLAGVSWSGLAVLHGVLFGAVAALSYGVFRLGLPRTLSTLGVVPVLLSTPNLTLLPHLRDYAKGPFLLAAILIMGVFVVRRNSSAATITLGATAGAVVGLGLGFRTDLMIAVPPIVAVIAVVAPVRSWAIRAAALAAFFTVFAIAASPILGVYSRGNNIGPVALLGLTEPFDAALGIQPSVYDFGSEYNDSLIFSIVNSYAVRIEGRRAGVDLATAEHAAASMAYLTAIVRTFPADFVTRTLAAARATPRYFLSASLDRPEWLSSPMFRLLFWLRGAVSSRLAPLAVPAAIVATVLISARSPRAAWLIVIVMTAFAGGSAIQFHERHFFYLQLVPWWAFGFFAVVAFRARTRPGGVSRTELRRALLFATVLASAVGAGVLVTRAYQQRTVAELLGSYVSAAREPVAVEQRSEDGRLLLTAAPWSAPMPEGAPRVATRFFAARFLDRSCGSDRVPVTLHYESALPELDFSESLSVELAPASGAQTLLFFPAFDRADESSRFRGVAVDAAHSACLEQIAEVRGLERTPLLLTSTLAPGWRESHLYQTLR